MYKKFDNKGVGHLKKNRKWIERYIPAIFLVVIITLVGLFSLNISHEVNNLVGNFDRFYKHPYKVRNAVSDFNLNAIKVVILWTGHSLENYTTSELEIIIKRKFEDLDSIYFIIKDNYLGESENTRALWEAYSAFKNYVNTADFSIDKINHHESNYEEINILLQGIVNKLEPIERYVTANAENYMRKSIIEKSFLLQKLNLLYIATIVFFIIGLFSVLYLIMSKNQNLYSVQEKFIKAIKFSPVPIIIHKNGIIEMISNEWVKLTGYTKEDIPTIEEWSRKAYGENYAASTGFLYKLYELDAPQEGGIWTVKTKSGGELIWKFRSGPLGDDYVFSSAIDVTEDHKKQQQIERLFNEKLKLATAVDQSPASIAMTDTKGNYEYVNNYFTELTGYSSDEVLGKKPSILKSGFHNEEFYKELWVTISSGNVWTGELQNKAKDGTLVWELASIYPIMDTDGKVTNYVAVKENITEKKLVEEALAKSEKKYRDLFDRSTDACLILKGGVVIDCNNAALKALGMGSRDELIGLKPSDVSPEFQEDGSRSDSVSLEKITEATKEKHLRFEWLHKKVDGEVIPSELMLTKIDDDDDEDYLYVVWRDITDRKKKEEELKESEQKLKAITDNLEGVVFRYIQYDDGTAAFNYISKGVEKLHGLTQEQLMNDETLLWNQIVEEDLDRVIMSFQESVKELSLWNYRYRIKSADGSIKWVRSTAHPIRDVENKCTIWDSIVFDVTRYVELKDKINQQLEEKTVLLSEVHHRVKNNLAIISGLLEMQVFTSENPKELGALSTSVQRIKTIAIIHEQIYKTGDFTAIAIDESLQLQIENLVNNYGADNGKDIEVNYDLDAVKINVNQAIPFGLLINELTTNSLKYAFDGIEQPILNISLHDKKDIIEFTIQSNGIGFTADDLKKSKDSLVQDLIHVFVSQLGGNLDIMSSPNNGTSVILTFQPTSKRGSSSNLVS